MALQNLIIRTDASTKIGTGHVMRCLALTQAWQEQGGQAIFVFANKSVALENRLLLEGMQVVYLSVEACGTEDAKQTADFALIFNAQWVVVDGYHFGAEYQKTIKDFGVSLLVFDDYGHAQHYYADFVLNQNIAGYNEDLYRSRESYTQLLLGTHYALLRREFWQWNGWRREISLFAYKLLVTFGGSDPDNVTLRVIQALNQVNINNLEVLVVIGSSNPHYEILQKEVAASRLTISLKRNVNNMAELMAWADLAIASGGVTCWELAFMGLPSLLILLADNQRPGIDKIDGLSTKNLGLFSTLSVKKITEEIFTIIHDSIARKKMAQHGQTLVDGMGALRTASVLNSTT